MNEDKQKIAELETEVAVLKQAISHNNDLVVGLERALIDVVLAVVGDNDDLQKAVLHRVQQDGVAAFDVTAYKSYRGTREFGDPDKQLKQPAGLLSRWILADNLSALQWLKA